MKEYLSEENYQRMNKKVKLVGIIIMLLGLCLIAFGIYFLVVSSKMSVPDMRSDNWFEASSAQMSMHSRGMFMIIPGIFLTIVGAMVRFVMGNQREIMAYQMGHVMPIATEGLEKMVPKMTKISKDVAEEMAPVYGKVAKTIAKDLAPVYGDVAKEITKGVKEGLKEEEKETDKD